MRIEEWRKLVMHRLIDKDMTLGDLAVCVGRTRQNVYQILHGLRKNPKAIKAICDALEIEPYERG